ncbi:MAG: hypothetical protein F4213_13165 [Boseongicola sp. SB0677_bin_26]|nr:hypothetical protein [Boseongicola sp. SB0665_bin_10]MYG26950.1 hypothetical protein [Boseongicola sp. SB0677_bin_26]
MSDKDEKKAKGRDIHTSYKGTFKADSLDVEEKTASAIITTHDGKEITVKGYNDHFDTLKEAFEAGGEVILRGKLLGSASLLHLAVYGTGPEHVAGVVKNPKDNFDSYEKDEKQPFIDLFVGVEKDDKTFWRGMTFFGDDALALKGKVTEGDRIELDVRPSQRKVGDNWKPVYVPEGPATVHPAAETEAKAEDETPQP